MLGLKLPTDPRWVNLAEKSISEIFTDHAYCEQKAASTCISLIQAYPECTRLVEELSPIVTEEWGHFRQVLTEMKKRGAVFGRQRKDEYVIQLRKLMYGGGSRIDQLCERLLISALIEARSCERFRLLSEGLEDESLRIFYRSFMESEAGHYRLFIDLANEYCEKEKVKKRWNELLAAEAEIIRTLDVKGERVH